MGYYLYVCHISGKVDFGEKDYVFLNEDNTFRKPTDEEFYNDLIIPCDLEYLQDNKITKKQVSDKYIKQLKDDICETFGCHSPKVSMKVWVMNSIDEFLNDIDKWVKDRKNKVLIKKIKRFVLPV